MSGDTAIESDVRQEVRQRKAQKSSDEDGGFNGQTQENDAAVKKTFGRTSNGDVFVVPQTHDMVSQLFSPSQPKNASDIVVLAVLFLHIITLWLLPSQFRVPVFAVVFIFWRACYNAGIGFLLHIQSKHLRLVAWARRSKLFANPKVEANPHPWIYSLMKRELETKIPEDYKFETAPIEYNTWLVFRRVVDLILMCDFVSYCLFAIACGGIPQDETWFMTVVRWATGLTLFGFNLWVKLDAHRVVKDYAWYWGDFFFLIDQQLTFDGVFEMAPHPMYSIGYAGYYGISMMAASYKVLAISIAAHAAQFAFLIWVENPHIDKIYNPPPARKQVDAQDSCKLSENAIESTSSTQLSNQPSNIHNLVGVANMDLHRVTDVAIVLLQIYLWLLTLLTPATRPYQIMFVINAAAWRLWYSLGIGFILDCQSNYKSWSRHFLKFGGSSEEAWREWKGTYHISMVMCHTSFLAACWKIYERPDDWTSGLAVLKHVVGLGLIALQLWTSVSIYDSLGEFGWFFGDFFFSAQRPKLTYNGIYRYLNNPERVIGLAGVWGGALITGSTAVTFLAALSHILTLAFIQFVERPHMEKLYGQSLRSESGLTKSLRRSLPPQILQWQGNVDKILVNTLDSVEDLIDAARPKIAAGVSHFVRDSTALFTHPTRISISRLAPDLAGFDPKDYSIELDFAAAHTRSEADGQPRASESLALDFGTPITIKWTAPLNHSRKDWIGLYMVADNVSRERTRIGSQGRWIATNRDQYGSIVADTGILVCDNMISGVERQDGEDNDYYMGEMKFSGDKLWWTTGVFEFRYHHNGGHNVMAISIPFEITLAKFDQDDVVASEDYLKSPITKAVESSVLQLVKNCFDLDPNIAPSDIFESFGSAVARDPKYAKRVVYALHQIFGIEFDPEVVRADGNVRNLAWRICNAKKVLQPFMSLSPGRNTPTKQD